MGHRAYWFRVFSRSLFGLVGSSLLFLPACGDGAGDGIDGTGGFGDPGGMLGSGGAFGSGGAVGSGGVVATGGGVGSGGTVGTGGAVGAGGVVGTGGSVGAGGATGTGGEVGMGGMPGTGGAGPEERRPPCMTNPNQVISMGDSYMNWASHTFPADLNAVAGVTFRPTYAVGGFSMGSGGIGLIPPLFDTALAQDPDIIAVVLDGGGNDVLIPALGRPDCKNMANANTNPGCQDIVTDAIAAAETLFMKIADAGVHDVIYFFYPHVPEPTALGGSHPNVMLDYALPLVRSSCESALEKTAGRTACWFVDTIPIFEGHPEYFAAADIHENAAGSRKIAEAVVAAMDEHCIAQPASSGCCEP